MRRSARIPLLLVGALIGMTGACAQASTDLSAPLTPVDRTVEPPEATAVRPFQAPTLDIITEPGPDRISSFEDCIASGYSIQRSFPRRCTTDAGAIFEEGLPEGVVFAGTFGEQGQEEVYSVIPTTDGGYLVTGRAAFTDCLVLKTDPIGGTTWQRTLSHEIGQELGEPFSLYACMSARQAPDGGYAILGSAFHDLPSVTLLFVMQLDSDGTIRSIQPIEAGEAEVVFLDARGNPVRIPHSGLLPSATVIESPEGGYAIVGMTSIGGLHDSTRLIQMDSAGVIAWDRELCTQRVAVEHEENALLCERNNVWDAIRARDGDYLVTGGDEMGAWLLRADGRGNVEWVRHYAGESGYSIAHSVVEIAEGGFLIAGVRNADGLLLRTDSNGTLEWQLVVGGSEDDRFAAIAHGTNGTYAVVGTTESFGQGNQDVWILGLDISILG